MKYPAKQFISLLLFHVLIVCSCESQRITGRINSAAEYLNSRPDTALIMVRSIDTTSILSPKWKAKYALVKAIALDKNYIDTTDSRFLLPALNYFKRFGSKEEIMKAFYYYGRIQYNGKDYQSAILSFLSALDASTSVDDPRFKGMIYGALADTHNKNHNNKDELKYAQLAFDSMIESQDTTLINLAHYKLGIAYHNNRFFDKADSLLSLVDGSEYLINEARIALADNEILKDAHDAERVTRLIEQTLESHGRMELKHYYEYAYALTECGRKEEADQYLASLSRYPDDAKSYWWRYRIANYNKDYKTALKYLDLYSEASDSVVVKRLEQSLYKAQAEHYSMATKVAKAESDNSRLTTIVVVLSSFILLFLLITGFSKYKNKLMDENEQLRFQQEESEKMIRRLKRIGTAEKNKYETQLSNLRSDFAKIYRKQFDEIVSLSANHFDSTTLSEKVKKAYSEKYSALIAELLDPEKQTIFETRLNEDLNDIMKKLRQDFPDLSEEQFRFLAYTIAGFDASSLSFLLNITKNNVWVRKSRLKEKILSSSSPNRSLYATFIR